MFNSEGRGEVDIKSTASNKNCVLTQFLFDAVVLCATYKNIQKEKQLTFWFSEQSNPSTHR